MHRSPVRSEWAPTTTIAHAAATYGMAEISATSTRVNEPKDWMICGDQKLMA